jgi:hypothetical protein
MQQRNIQILGWYGVIAILTAYTLLVVDVMSPDSMLNLTGAIGIVIEAASKRDRQPMVLNSIWAIVALIAILRVWLS